MSKYAIVDKETKMYVSKVSGKYTHDIEMAMTGSSVQEITDLVGCCEQTEFVYEIPEDIEFT